MNTLECEPGIFPSRGPFRSDFEGDSGDESYDRHALAELIIPEEYLGFLNMADKRIRFVTRDNTPEPIDDQVRSGTIRKRKRGPIKIEPIVISSGEGSDSEVEPPK